MGVITYTIAKETSGKVKVQKDDTSNFWIIMAITIGQLLLIFLVLYFIFIKNFRVINMEMERLRLIQQSNVEQYFQEIENGVVTIRSFRIYLKPEAEGAKNVDASYSEGAEDTGSKKLRMRSYLNEFNDQCMKQLQDQARVDLLVITQNAWFAFRSVLSFGCAQIMVISTVIIGIALG